MQNLDWSNLGFEVRKTDAVIVAKYKDGAWSEPEVVRNLNMTLNVYAGVFHYANSCFEGLKAFRGADGKARLFRPDENARKLQRAGKFLDMAYPTEVTFIVMGNPVVSHSGAAVMTSVNACGASAARSVHACTTLYVASRKERSRTSTSGAWHFKTEYI